MSKDSSDDSSTFFSLFFPNNLSKNPNPYEDEDGLPAGWELFFNGTLWNKPEVYIAVYDHNWNRSSEYVYGPPGAWKTGTEGQYIGKFDPKMRDTDQAPPMDGAADYDGDSYNNSAERAGHSDPTDTNSHPEVGGGRGMEPPPMEESPPELPEEPGEDIQPVPTVEPVIELQAEIRKQEREILPADEIAISRT